MQGTPLISKAANLLTAVRSDAGVNGSRSSQAAATPLLSVSKPSWIVTTQSNVRLEKRKIQDPPCVVCRGSGRVDCHECHGRGRTNHVQSTVLPKGEWPKWCRSCGGSGLGYCDRCLGTGEYRYIMGFQFMKRDTDHNTQDNQAHQMGDRRGGHSFTELLLNEIQLDSDSIAATAMTKLIPIRWSSVNLPDFLYLDTRGSMRRLLIKMKAATLRMSKLDMLAGGMWKPAKVVFMAAPCSTKIDCI